MDLRDFCYLPLDVVRLRDSELAAVGDAEVFRAAVIAWCVAWHQIPSSSLPDDDGVLARMLGYGRDVDYWRQLRANGALRGFCKCSDGRLYHWLVAEKARTAWEQKLKQRQRTANARAAKLAHAKNEATVAEPPPGTESQSRDDLTETATSAVTNTKREGEGEGEGKEQRKGQKIRSKSPKTKAPTNCTVAIPEWVPLEEWAAFLHMRHGKGAPSTPRAIALLVNRLNELRERGEDIATVLDQSVMHGWRGVFPVKREISRHEYRKQSPGSVLQTHLAGFAALVDETDRRKASAAEPEALTILGTKHRA